MDELTQREREVIALLAEGHSNSEIGKRMFISDRAVEKNIARARWKIVGWYDPKITNLRVVLARAYWEYMNE